MYCDTVYDRLQCVVTCDMYCNTVYDRSKQCVAYAAVDAVAAGGKGGTAAWNTWSCWERHSAAGMGALVTCVVTG
jgi:hypothetical protein